MNVRMIVVKTADTSENCKQLMDFASGLIWRRIHHEFKKDGKLFLEIPYPSPHTVETITKGIGVLYPALELQFIEDSSKSHQGCLRTRCID